MEWISVISMAIMIICIIALMVVRHKLKEELDRYTNMYRREESRNDKLMDKKHELEHYLAVIESEKGWKVVRQKSWTVERVETADERRKRLDAEHKKCCQPPKKKAGRPRKS